MNGGSRYNKESTAIWEGFLLDKFIMEKDPECKVGRNLEHGIGNYLWTEVGHLTSVNIGDATMEGMDIENS